MQVPKTLKGPAKKEWAFITEHLDRLGLLDEIDKTALELYCLAYGRYLKAEADVAAHGEIVLAGKDGTYPMVSAYAQQRNKAFDQVCKILAEFGLSPKARGSLNVTPEIEVGESDDQLKVKWWESLTG